MLVYCILITLLTMNKFLSGGIEYMTSLDGNNLEDKAMQGGTLDPLDALVENENVNAIIRAGAHHMRCCIGKHPYWLCQMLWEMNRDEHERLRAELREELIDHEG